MPGREIASKSEVEIAFDTETVTFNGVTNGIILDLQRSNAILFVIHAGTITDGSFGFTFEEDDGVGFSSPVAIPDSDLRGNLSSDLIFVNTDGDTVRKVSLVNNKRFVRMIVTTSGASTGGIFSATAIKQDLSLTPIT